MLVAQFVFGQSAARRIGLAQTQGVRGQTSQRRDRNRGWLDTPLTAARTKNGGVDSVRNQLPGHWAGGRVGVVLLNCLAKISHSWGFADHGGCHIDRGGWWCVLLGQVDAGADGCH